MTTESLRLQLGKGPKVATLNIGTDGANYPIWIEDNGKAGISYYNVDVVPPRLSLPENKIQQIRDYLGELRRKPGPRLWHSIKAENTPDLVNKLKKIIEIILGGNQHT